MIYFTSDQHFGHRNIIRFCSRPFSTVGEMDAALIWNWNKKVSNADTVYILGDLMYRNERPPEYYLGQLNGKKHLILGNHDESWLGTVAAAEWFESISDQLTFFDGQRKIAACHYPMFTWPDQPEAYMLFGHIHNDTGLDIWPSIRASDKLLNVSVDVNDYAPVSFEELAENNRRFKEAH